MNEKNKKKCYQLIEKILINMNLCTKETILRNKLYTYLLIYFYEKSPKYICYCIYVYKFKDIVAYLDPETHSFFTLLLMNAITYQKLNNNNSRPQKNVKLEKLLFILHV